MPAVIRLTIVIRVPSTIRTFGSVRTICLVRHSAGPIDDVLVTVMIEFKRTDPAATARFSRERLPA
jgi:hypothetical protein